MLALRERDLPRWLILLLCAAAAYFSGLISGWPLRYETSPQHVESQLAVEVPVVPEWVPKTTITEFKQLALLIDGEKVWLSMQFYNPPFFVTRPLLMHISDTKLITPEDAHLSQLSADNREWLLSCFEPKSRMRLLKLDESHQGSLFKHLKTIRKQPWPPASPKAYAYRAFLSKKTAQFCFLGLCGTEDNTAIVLAFVQMNGRWLRTTEWDASALMGFLSETKVEMIADLVRQRVVVAPTPVAIKTEMIDDDGWADDSDE